jgi:hypothetical protein
MKLFLDGSLATLDMVEQVITAGDEVEAELSKALQNFEAMPTVHDGYAVMLEEMDELWDLVKKSKPFDHPKYDPAVTAAMRREACQVAAMAMRFMIDLTDAVDADRAEVPT